MKINWFSPLPPARTDVADYTKHLLPALQKHAEIVLWTNQEKWDPELKQYATVRHFESAELPWLEFNQANLSIYNIGNNPDFHYLIWEISRRSPGVVILHDFKLHNFFEVIYLKVKQSPSEYITQMAKYYGAEGRQNAEEFFWSGTLTTDHMVEHYPFTQLALENAIGVITHARGVFYDLRQEKQWPLIYTPFPYLANSRVINSSARKGKPYRIVVFGYFSTNRRLDVLLRALASLTEKSHFQLDVYGQVSDVASIRKHIQELDLSRLVTLHGFVEDAKLDSALANAHLAINLRYPTMGEASGSQLRIWSHALPSFVTQVGWYAELPENIVSFIRPEHEIEDIQRNLRNFLENPSKFVEMGKNGKRFLEEKHTPEVCVQAIIDFANNLRSQRRHYLAKKLLERVGEQISIWNERTLIDSDIRKVAEAIDFISS